MIIAFLFLTANNNKVDVNKKPADSKVCRYLFTAKLLCMLRVSQHPSSGVLKTVPEAAGTVFNTPDDGCCDIRSMQSSFTVNKYLHTVVSVGFLLTFNYDARNHELKKNTVDVNYKSILSRWELRQRVHSSQPILGSEPFSGLSHLVCLPK